MPKSVLLLACLILMTATLSRAAVFGEAAPDFSLKGIDGVETTLSQLRGDGSLLLDFGSVFCPNCQQTLSKLKEIARDYAGRGLRVAAINIDSRNSARAVKAITGELKLDYPVLLDPEGVAATAYGVDQIPHAVLIDDKGKIRSVHTGSATGLERLIGSLFGPGEKGR